MLRCGQAEARIRSARGSYTQCADSCRFCIDYYRPCAGLGSPTLSYKRAYPAEHNEYWVVDAEPNGIMPPPRRAMGPAGTVDGPIGRCLLPIGGGSAEVARKFYFLIKIRHPSKVLYIFLEHSPFAGTFSKRL